MRHLRERTGSQVDDSEAWLVAVSASHKVGGPGHPSVLCKSIASLSFRGCEGPVAQRLLAVPLSAVTSGVGSVRPLGVPIYKPHQHQGFPPVLFGVMTVT